MGGWDPQCSLNIIWRERKIVTSVRLSGINKYCMIISYEGIDLEFYKCFI